jgi:eukaryotic-like serine/threonine-protein kinase
MINKDEYRFVSLIGSGSFSIVKKYQHIKSERLVAFKELKQELITDEDSIYRFRREIAFLKLLNCHPNIIELIGDDIVEPNYLYIMPLASINLYDYIKSNNSTITLDVRLTIFDQVLNALKASHEKQILHRDICPQNVLLFINKSEVTVKVSDFGIGKNYESVSAFTKSEIDKFGHVYYVAPEQREKLKDATVRSDIYSLGKLLNFIMTGKDPDILYPCDLSAIISRATNPKPESRFADVAEFERNYEQVKKLLSSGGNDDEFTFMNSAPNGELSYNWHAFHLFAVKGNYRGHVYHDYIHPIILTLSENENLESYCSFAENALEEFLETFIDNLHICFQTTGWPFSATESFGNLLGRIFYISPNPRAKIQCLKELWDIAYEQDQWSVQGNIESILDGSSIPPEIQTEFAKFILDSSPNVNLEKLLHLKIPNVIMRAIKLKINSD